MSPPQDMFDPSRQDHAQFYDLCKKLLNFDPNRRTPPPSSYIMYFLLLFSVIQLPYEIANLLFTVTD